MDDITIRERRPLGLAHMVGDDCVRVHRRLACPHCGGKLHAHDVRVIPDGWALTCGLCHVDVIVREAL